MLSLQRASHPGMSARVRRAGVASGLALCCLIKSFRPKNRPTSLSRKRIKAWPVASARRPLLTHLTCRHQADGPSVLQHELWCGALMISAAPLRHDVPAETPAEAAFRAVLEAASKKVTAWLEEIITDPSPLPAPAQRETQVLPWSPQSPEERPWEECADSQGF